MTEPKNGAKDTETLARTPLWRRPLVDCALALSVLTRLPVAADWFEGRPLSPLGRSVWAFSVVGLIVGSVGGIGLMAASELGLHPLTCALIAVGLTAVVTGALHEDGLADVADGFGGGADAKTKLKIMRDSRIGSFGVLALILVVGLRITALATLPGPGMAAAAVLAGAVLSRAAMGAVMTALKPARKDGLGAMAGKAPAAQAGAGLGVALIVCLLATPVRAALLGFVAALVGVALLTVLARRQIGGFTGDVLGAAQGVSDVLFLLVCAGASQWY